MAATKAVWGIDLGQCALKAIKLQPSENGVEAVDYVYIEHPKILSQPDVDRNALIAEAMKKFLDQHDLTKESIVVGVPGQHTLARFSKLPPVDKKKIPEIVKFEAQQQIPFDMDEVIWDYQTFTSGETETEVGIFAMRRELLRSHLHFVAGFNLEPAAVQSGPLALYNALTYDGVCGKEPMVILDIGTQNADLIVADGNSLWTRNIPIGGNAFTEAMSKTFKVSFRKAENLKRDAAKSKYARQIFQAMRPVFADLVAEVQRSIGFFTSSRRGVKLTKLVAMGAAFKLPGLQKFLQQNLGMDVIRPASFGKMSTANVPNAPQLTEQLMSFGVAYGLALQGLGLANITSNLLPPEIAKQVIWRKKMPWFYGAAACLVLSAVVVWGRNIRDKGVIDAAQAQGAPPSLEPIYDPKDTERTNPKPNPQAIEVLKNGPKGTTAVERANWVVAAAKGMDECVDKLQTANTMLTDSAKKVGQLQSNKAVWPAVLRMIHSVIPKDNDINEAMKKGPEAYVQLLASNPDTYARPKRKQVFITNFKSQFSPDVMSDFRQVKASRAAAGTTGFSTGTPSADEGAGSGVPLPGFLVALKGRTTNAEGYEFLRKTFFANMQKAKDGKEVYVADLYPVDCTQVGKMAKDAAGGTAAYSTYGTGAAKSPTALKLLDPLTKESTLTDWEFEVVIAVVIGEKPATPGEKR